MLWLQATLKRYQTEHRSKLDSLEKSQAELKKIRRKSQGARNVMKYEHKEMEVSALALICVFLCRRTGQQKKLMVPQSWCVLKALLEFVLQLQLSSHCPSVHIQRLLVPRFHPLTNSWSVPAPLCRALHREPAKLCKFSSNLLQSHFPK